VEKVEREEKVWGWLGKYRLIKGDEMRGDCL
jgi:hypothetical protein